MVSFFAEPAYYGGSQEPTNYEIWHPHRPQEPFLQSPAFEALFGGAAGPGKSDCLLIEATRQIENPRYNGILFRRTFNRLEAADGLIARSLRWYPALGGRYNAGKHYWTFPSGARIYFGHMQNEGDEQIYQGAQYAFMGFDELTEFLEKQYMYLFSRCRVDVATGLTAYIRAATNPGGIGHVWVKKRFITSDVRLKIKWFTQLPNEFGQLADTRVARVHPLGRSRVFYPARFSDNPSLQQEYIATLSQITDPVERLRLMEGDWEAESTEGRVYPNWSYRNISDEAEYNPAYGPVYWSADDGYQNPRCILLTQMRPDGGVNVFDELYETHQLAETSIQQVLAKRQRNGQPYPLPEVVYYDPSAAQFAAQCWEHQGLFTVQADNRVSEGIKAVRDYILDANGVISLYVHPRCVNLIEHLPNYRYDVKKSVQGGDPVVLKENDHAPDALRYFIATHCVILPKSRRT